MVTNVTMCALARCQALANPADVDDLDGYQASECIDTTVYRHSYAFVTGCIQ